MRRHVSQDVIRQKGIPSIVIVSKALSVPLGLSFELALSLLISLSRDRVSMTNRRYLAVFYIHIQGEV